MARYSNPTSDYFVLRLRARRSLHAHWLFASERALLRRVDLLSVLVECVDCKSRKPFTS